MGDYPYDREAYRERQTIERTINRLSRHTLGRCGESSIASFWSDLVQIIPTVRL